MVRKLLLLLALLSPGVAHAAWVEASTTHFVVYSDDTPDHVRAFATNLERFDKALRFLRNLADEPVGMANRVTIFVVDDIPAIERLIGRQGVAGFYSPRAGNSVAFVPRDAGVGEVPLEYREMVLNPRQILLHEYTHHFLLSLSPNVAYPGWFVEGYAEFFATAEFEPDGAVIVGRPPQYRVFGLFGENRLTVAKMLTADPNELTGEQRYLLYGRGWLLTHYLFLGGKRDGQLGAYFRALTDGKPASEAAQAFGDLRALDSELWAYKRTDFAAQRVAASVLPIGEVSVRTVSPAESATMLVRIRSTAGVDDRAAQSVYAAAKAACAPYPNDPAAQRVLAEAAFDAKDFAGAEAAADRALAADPQHVGAMLYKAMARMALAKQAGDATPATWTAIRRIIAAANRIDTQNPAVLWLFYQSYLAAGQAPTAVAKQGLHYAYALAPQDRGLRFDSAEAHLRDGELALARPLLVTIAADPHAGNTTAKLAARIVAAIDAGHPEQAIAEIEKDRREREARTNAP